MKVATKRITKIGSKDTIIIKCIGSEVGHITNNKKTTFTIIRILSTLNKIIRKFPLINQILIRTVDIKRTTIPTTMMASITRAKANREWARKVPVVTRDHSKIITFTNTLTWNTHRTILTKSKWWEFVISLK